MKRLGVAVAAIGLAVFPATASANHGTTCSYAATQGVAVTQGDAVVYADPDGSSGMSGQANAAAGACYYDPVGVTVGGGTVHGGTVEAGEGTNADGTPGVYAIADGDNANTLGGNTDGFAGLSNYETSPPKGNCAPGSGSGTNSGGCLDLTVLPVLPVPLIACGNTTGNSWDASSKDGCRVIEMTGL